MSWPGPAIAWGYAEGHPWVVVVTTVAIAAFAVAFVIERGRQRRRGRR